MEHVFTFTVVLGALAFLVNHFVVLRAKGRKKTSGKCTNCPSCK